MERSLQTALRRTFSPPHGYAMYTGSKPIWAKAAAASSSIRSIWHRGGIPARRTWRAGRTREAGSGADQLQRLVGHGKHAAEFMSSLEDQTARGNRRKRALPARQRRRLDDLVERHLAGAPEDREHRTVPQMVDGIVAPFACR